MRTESAPHLGARSLTLAGSNHERSGNISSPLIRQFINIQAANGPSRLFVFEQDRVEYGVYAAPSLFSFDFSNYCARPLPMFPDFREEEQHLWECVWDSRHRYRFVEWFDPHTSLEGPFPTLSSRG